MALIKCKNCGKEVSDSAKECIHCGSSLQVLKCRECGKEISEDDDVCKNCGCPVKTEEEQKKAKKKKKDNITIVVIVIIIIIIGIIALIALQDINKVEVPSLYNTKEDSASLILTNNNLIPNIEYRYDDNVEEGNVISSSPYSGEKVDKNTTVTIYISKGPSVIYSSQSNIQWYHIGTKDDKWTFTNPRIEEGYLYIDCKPTFAKSFSWVDGGIGTASINDSFSKTVPVKIIQTNENVQAYVEQSITLKLSVKDLDVQKPTTLYMKLTGKESNNKQFDINVNFSISW